MVQLELNEITDKISEVKDLKEEAKSSKLKDPKLSVSLSDYENILRELFALKLKVPRLEFKIQKYKEQRRRK